MAFCLVSTLVNEPNGRGAGCAPGLPNKTGVCNSRVFSVFLLDLTTHVSRRCFHLVQAFGLGFRLEMGYML